MDKEIKTVYRALFYASGEGQALGGTNFRELPAAGVASLLRDFAESLSGTGRDTPSGGATSATTGGATPTTTAGSKQGLLSPDDEAEIGAFLSQGARLLHAEMRRLCDRDPSMRRAVSAGAELFAGATVGTGAVASVAWDQETRQALWQLFFPEGARLSQDLPGGVRDLRDRRTVHIERLNPSPVRAPLEELLFTSNALVTVPADPEAADLESLPESLRDRVIETMSEEQMYHYDHPIHIGVPLTSNEAVYGLRGLDRMVAYEKEVGHVDPDGKATVVLSLSVTHEGLHRVAPDYLRNELAREGRFEHLKVYLFTELECEALVEALFEDVGAEVDAEAGSDTGASNSAVKARVREVFGVDGEYGRHYSFLKAVAALWQVFVDPAVRGTFKIDLDQVFPQEELVSQAGESALEHFQTPLWGATARDSSGRLVELGMIAGALVNEKDIHRGLFTPDVPYPDTIPPGEAAVFYNRLPMALSTEAEMMTRYDGRLEGSKRCLMRYHVTGGTNGILVESLRRHRPFTPSFVGRAEDQAYIMSRLFGGEDEEGNQGGDGDSDPGTGKGGYLRYVHKPGLIMRHDKEAFAGEAIEAARHGRFIGDLLRTYYFSRYAEALPWGFDATKDQLDPFTGCFATRRTWNVIMLRLVLHCAALVNKGEAEEEVLGLLGLAARRLGPFLKTELEGLSQDSVDEPTGVGAIRRRYHAESLAWNRYYDALDAAEAAIAQDRHQGGGASSVRRVVEGARVL